LPSADVGSGDGPSKASRKLFSSGSHVRPTPALFARPTHSTFRDVKTESFSSSSVLEHLEHFLNSSSGCSVEIRTAGDYTYDDLHNNELLAETYVQFMSDHFGFEMDRHNDSTASTGAFIYPFFFFLYLCRKDADRACGADFGNVTYTLPACHPGFKIPAPTGSSNHTVPSPSPSTLVLL
jgi:hypothetical protein